MKPPVLVIDDEPDILASLRRLLRHEFEVYAASSGAEGLSILAEHEIHAILTDQRMPSMTGADVLSSARHNHPDAIRILFTGYADLEDVIRAVNNGEIYRYLVKPWNPEELIGVVREACERYDLIISRRRLTEQLQEINAELEVRVQQRTAELAEANARLEQVNQLKDEFLAIISHDLRTPLSGIMGAAELLQTADEHDAAKHSELVTIIGASGQRMLAMVNNLLDLAHIEAEGITLDVRALALPALLTECMHALQPVARISGVTCRLESAPDVPLIFGDNARLYEVFINLIGNAIKFTGAHGAVTVTCARHDGDTVRVNVQDTGPGIPREVMPSLFTRFTQVRTLGRNRQRRGTGLGLYITKQLVELHGGQVGVESIVGRGANFWVLLPLMPPGVRGGRPAAQIDL